MMSLIPYESTILRFRHRLEEHTLRAQILNCVNTQLAHAGLLFKAGTVVDVALIAAPSSTKNSTGQRDPEMHQAKRGNHWHIALRPGKRQALNRQSPWGALLEQAQKIKASVRAKVRHPFRVIKCPFGFTKVRYRGLAKNTAQLITLLALSNLRMARYRLTRMAAG